MDNNSFGSKIEGVLCEEVEAIGKVDEVGADSAGRYEVEATGEIALDSNSSGTLRIQIEHEHLVFQSII